MQKIPIPALGPGTRWLALSLIAFLSACAWTPAKAPMVVEDYVLEAGHPSLADWKITAAPTYPSNNPPVAAIIALGETLFFDKALSANNDRSCASCHDPELMWSDGLPTALALDGQPLPRATPTLVNVGYVEPIMWDGRAPSLEHQAMLPILNAEEMGGEVDVVLARLSGSAAYRKKFEAAYGNDSIDSESISRALASFQRTLVSRSTNFDRWVEGDASAMSPAAVRGFGIFVDNQKGRCTTCHSAPLFTDNSFHNVGLPENSAHPSDTGRYAVVPLKSMMGAFRTPQLREIGATSPYFHDGSSTTLEEVVEHYVSGMEQGPHLSRDIHELTLSEQEKDDLVAFLESLVTPASKRPTIAEASTFLLNNGVAN